MTFSNLILLLSFLAISVSANVLIRPTAPATPPTTEVTQVEILDNDGRLVTKTGDLACWITNGQNGEFLEKPIISKPIYKYCSFAMVADNGDKAYSSGFREYTEDDGYVDNMFANHKKVVFSHEHFFLFGYKKRPQSRRVFFCKTMACNVPFDFMTFLEFNMRMDENAQSQFLGELGYKSE